MEHLIKQTLTMEDNNATILLSEPIEKIEAIKIKDFLTVKDASQLLNISTNHEHHCVNDSFL